MRIIILSNLLAAFAAVTASAAFSQDFQGNWDTTYGTVKIREETRAQGPSFLCGYYSDKGLIAGWAQNGRARGVFIHADQQTGAAKVQRDVLGTFEWNLLRSNNIKGTWRWTIDPTQPGDREWNGRRTSVTQASGFSTEVKQVCQQLSNLPVLAAWRGELQRITRPYTIRANYPDDGVLFSDIVLRENLSALGNCYMNPARPSHLACDRGGNAPVNIDIRDCVPGSLRPFQSETKGMQIMCNAAIYGSYTHSCEAPTARSVAVSATSEIAQMAVHTACNGPKLAKSEANSFPKITQSSSQIVYYSTGNGGQYLNRVNTQACPSRTYWNENGVMRCVIR